MGRFGGVSVGVCRVSMWANVRCCALLSFEVG